MTFLICDATWTTINVVRKAVAINRKAPTFNSGVTVRMVDGIVRPGDFRVVFLILIGSDDSGSG
jgi:hypothetical protein